MSLENTRMNQKHYSKTSRVSLSTSYETLINGGQLKGKRRRKKKSDHANLKLALVLGYLKMKNLETNTAWKKLWTILDENHLLIYYNRSELNLIHSVELTGCKITPADWLTKQKL